MKKFQNPENILSIVSEIFTTLNLESTPKELFQQILDFCIRFSGATTGSLIVLNPVTHILEIKVSRGFGADMPEKVKLKEGQGLTGWSVENKEPVLCNDVKQDARYIAVKEYIQSELVVPLLCEDRVIGAISVDSSKREAFNDNDINLLLLIAPLVAQIIRNAELYETLKKQYDRDEILLRIHRESVESPTAEEAMTHILNLMFERIAFQRSSILMYNPDKHQLNPVASYGLTIEEKLRGQYGKNEGVIGQIIYAKEPVIIQDLSKESDFLNKTQSREQLENISFIALPIIFRKKVIGVLWFDKDYRNSVTTLEEDVNLAEFVCSYLTQLSKSYQEERYGNQVKNDVLPYFMLDFELQTTHPKIEACIQSIRTHSQTGSNLFIQSSNKLERYFLAVKAYENQPDPESKPFMFMDLADMDHTKQEELFLSPRGKRKIERLLQGNFIFADSIHLLGKSAQKVLRSIIAKENTQIVTGTDLNDSTIQENDLISPIFTECFDIKIKLPEFHEREADLRKYLQYFRKKANKIWQLQITGITPEAEDYLIKIFKENYDALFDLMSFYIKAAIVKNSGILALLDIKNYHSTEKSSSSKEVKENLEQYTQKFIENLLSENENHVYDQISDFFERKLYEIVYNKSDGNKLRIAKLLSQNRATVYKKLRKFGII